MVLVVVVVVVVVGGRGEEKPKFPSRLLERWWTLPEFGNRWWRLVAILTLTSFVTLGFRAIDQPISQLVSFRTAEIEQLYRVKRMIRGIGHVVLDLLSNWKYVRSKSFFGEPLKHVINTCARGAGTHRDVFERAHGHVWIHTQSFHCATTRQDKTKQDTRQDKTQHNTTTRPQHHTEIERQRQRETEKEDRDREKRRRQRRETKEDKTRQDRKRRDKTRMQEKMQEERPDKTRQECKEKREDETQNKRR